MRAYRVLITGVSSLIGKGILDSLEGRRDGLLLIGTGFGAISSEMLRCDGHEFTVPSDHPKFSDQLRTIIERYEPDIVIPAREPDVLTVAELDVPSVTGVGGEIAADKWLTYEFAMEHGLPIVPTTLPGGSDFGLPAICKPRAGGGSVGVRLLMSQEALDLAHQEPDVIIQPLIGPTPHVPDLSAGIPMFWSLEPTRQGGVQAVIGPDGETYIAAAFETAHQFGWVIEQHLVDDAELMQVGMRYLQALAAHGWRGPLNVSTVWDGQEWLCLELNPRFTGGTAARTAMGFDEVGWALNAWARREVVAPLSEPRGDSVVQRLHAYPIWRNGIR